MVYRSWGLGVRVRGFRFKGIQAFLIWSLAYSNPSKSSVNSVAVCCSVLQCVAVWCSVEACCNDTPVQQVCECAAVCYSVLQCVTVCCSVMQCWGVWQWHLRSACVRVLQCVTVHCSVRQCIAVCCSVAVCKRPIISRSLLIEATPYQYTATRVVLIIGIVWGHIGWLRVHCNTHSPLFKNIVSIVGLFCKRDL